MSDATPSMSVAYVSPAWPTSTVSSGIATYVEQMRSGLIAAGHRAVVLAAEKCGEWREEEVVVAWTRYRPSLASRLVEESLRRVGLSWAERELGQRRTGRGIADALQRCRGPISILEMEETQGIVRQVIKQVPIPVVVRLHGPTFVFSKLPLPRDPHRPQRICRERRGILMAHGVSAPSRWVKTQMEEHLGPDCPPIELIPNPVAIPDESHRWSRRAAEPQHVLYVGRLEWAKGVDVLLDAFRSIGTTHPHASLTLVGPDRGVSLAGGHPIPIAELVDRLVPEASIRSRVKWIGPRPLEQLGAIRRQAAVVVVPSRFETFSLTVAEAAALGCPIVASRVGGIPEIIEHGRNGRLFAVGEPESLAAELRAMLDDPDGAEGLGRQALRDCIERFSAEVVARRSVDFYRRVIERHRVRRA